MRNYEYERYDDLFPDIRKSLPLEIDCYLCNQCYNFIGQDIIWGNGPRGARIMVVGKDSAGGDSNERLWKGSRCTGIPLTNKKSGAKIRILLKNAGIDPHEVFFTNTVKCNTGYDKFGLTDKTFRKLAKCCTHHLLNEITIIEPHVIICLGKDAHKVVCGMVKKYKTVVNQKNCKYLKLKHPSRVEGRKRELEYIEKIKQIKEKQLHVE